jgi:hypothetical protein
MSSTKDFFATTMDNLFFNIKFDVIPPLEQNPNQHESMLMCILNEVHKLQITSLILLSIKLGHWVKPRSMFWFSKFLLTKFDKDRWVEIFCMSKVTLFNIVDCWRSTFQKQNIEYCKVVPRYIHVWVKSQSKELPK